MAPNLDFQSEDSRVLFARAIPEYIKTAVQNSGQGKEGRDVSNHINRGQKKSTKKQKQENNDLDAQSDKS